MSKCVYSFKQPSFMIGHWLPSMPMRTEGDSWQRLDEAKYVKVVLVSAFALGFNWNSQI